MKKRAHVVLPESVITALDRLVGPRKRSRFIIEAVEKELHRLARECARLEAREHDRATDHLGKRVGLLRLYVGGERAAANGAWQAEDHPELDLGVEAWVNELREQDRPRDERGNRG